MSKRKPSDGVMKNGEWWKLVPGIFADCVGKESTRYAIERPFLQDAFLYATDGSICVRMKASKDLLAKIELDSDVKTPPMKDLLWGAKRIGKLDLPATMENCEPLPCPNSQCFDGQCHCRDCGTEHECGKCSGSGYLPVKRLFTFNSKDGKVRGLCEVHQRTAIRRSLTVYATDRGGLCHIESEDGSIDGQVMLVDAQEQEPKTTVVVPIPVVWF